MGEGNSIIVLQCEDNEGVEGEAKLNEPERMDYGGWRRARSPQGVEGVPAQAVVELMRYVQKREVRPGAVR